MNNRILIAGTHSGCGKTTVTCALLSALKARGQEMVAFKCGPDYIDPMFHRQAIGVPSHNLDPFFCTGEQLRTMLAGQGSGLSLIEGVMGYYDGIGAEGRASTYDVSRETRTPVVLVVNTRGMYTSAGALLQGFRNFRPQNNLRGVIFNGASPMLYEGLKGIAREAGLIPLGFLPYHAESAIASRHLGLITADEIADIRQKLCALGALAAQSIDMDGLLELAASASPLQAETGKIKPIASVRIAVARDTAFCFLYEENLEMLRALGCELCFFSPLRDTALPAHIGGLYLPGGYPELHLEALSANAVLRRAIRQAVAEGLPTIAECGGFLYLHDRLDGFPMAGVIPAKAYKTERLQRFGYVILTAKRDNLFCMAGESIRAHEFHYYESEACGQGFSAQKPVSGPAWECVHATDSLYAGFPHLYFPVHPASVERFVRKANQYAAANDS
ncbi:MAG: cobyrinate a,c-diamide synthase [Candidatus Pelethousia sp.]|nr:cobyrinate a,c-diamide synthase [Candidatus Pelethousia sp.]